MSSVAASGMSAPAHGFASKTGLEIARVLTHMDDIPREVSAATGKKTAMSTARESIEANLKAFSQSFNRGDAAAVAAHYGDDAALLPPDAARVDGRRDIQGAWQALIDAEVRDFVLATQEVDVFGDVANEVGTIRATAPGEGGGRVPWVGKYVAVWKRGGDGTWRMHRDIWNFDG